ncbi:hypothetical protein BDV10DRAFT_173339 [Aspergillus recurvatus]
MSVEATNLTRGPMYAVSHDLGPKPHTSRLSAELAWLPCSFRNTGLRSYIERTRDLHAVNGLTEPNKNATRLNILEDRSLNLKGTEAGTRPNSRLGIWNGRISHPQSTLEAPLYSFEERHSQSYIEPMAKIRCLVRDRGATARADNS